VPSAVSLDFLAKPQFITSHRYKMSTDQGQKLFDKLSELNYPKISKFNPSSFDWLFDSDEALPFLDWFCDSIHSGLHLLSDSELKKWVPIFHLHKL